MQIEQRLALPALVGGWVGQLLGGCFATELGRELLLEAQEVSPLNGKVGQRWPKKSTNSTLYLSCNIGNKSMSLK